MSYVEAFLAGLVWLVTSILRVAAAAVACIVVTLAFTILSCVSGALLGVAVFESVRYLESLPPISSMSTAGQIILAVHMAMAAMLCTWALITIGLMSRECNRRTAAVASWCMRVGKSQSKRITITAEELEPHSAG